MTNIKYESVLKIHYIFASKIRFYEFGNIEIKFKMNSIHIFYRKQFLLMIVELNKSKSVLHINEKKLFGRNKLKLKYTAKSHLHGRKF